MYVQREARFFPSFFLLLIQYMNEYDNNINMEKKKVMFWGVLLLGDQS